jgi:signal transduction histidine kinase
MVVVLFGAGWFAYARLRTDLNERISASLVARADAVSALTGQRPASLETLATSGLVEPGESFAQILSLDGRVMDRAGGPASPVLSAAERARASRGSVFVERAVRGTDGTARMLARPLVDSGARTVVVVGQALDDRDEELAGVVRSFAVGGPVAVALASAIGYLLAMASLRPVEAMRRRAGEVALTGDPEWLPLPAARDEVRRLGETLNEMLDRLRQSSARERVFVADASHELRTPIAVIKTELEGALRAGVHSPDVHAALVSAAEECDSLAQLAEDLLVIARAADGELPVRPVPLAAAGLLETVRNGFIDRAERQGRRIDIAADAGVRFGADPLRLRQALGNLVDNALRHGTGDILLSAERQATAVHLEVSDQGNGFPAEVVDRAFERFTRSRAARGEAGAGLGMAIVRTIAEAHGGSAVIVAGPRTTVRVSLPDTA